MKKKKNSSILVYTLVSFLLALLVCAVLMLVSGYSPIIAYSAMLYGAFGNTYNLAQTLGISIPLIFAGIAMAVGDKTGIFNIGIEGQIIAGAVPAALVGAYVKNVPSVLHILLCMIVAVLFGGIWAVFAALIKNKLQISEVIITIMLNYIAYYLANYFINYPFKAEGMISRTEEIQKTAMLVPLVAHSRLTTGIFLALLAVVLYWVFLNKTRLGYEMRATGGNPSAAENAGISNFKNQMIAMFISGGLAGIAGACEVLGVQGYYIADMTTGYGYSGVAIAVMGHSNPLGTLLSALLFGALNAGSASMNRMTSIPGEFISVLQALIIVFVATPGIVRAMKTLLIRRKVTA